MDKNLTYFEASGASGYHTHIEAEAKDGVAQFRLVDRISEYSEASAEAVRMLAEGFVKQGLKKAHLFISSRGGDPMQATDIAIELQSKFEDVEITVGAIAASAVTRIMVEFDIVKGHPNSQFMIHRPKMGTYGDENQIKANLKVLKNTTTDYRTAYAKRFKKTEDEIEAMWKDGDYWMNAQEAKRLGLISEILAEKQSMKAEDVAVLTACGAPTIPAPEPEKNDKSKTEMDINAMRSALGLDANATEEQVLAAAKAAKEKAAKADELEASATKNAKERAEAFAKKAQTDKKIDADQVESITAWATTDFDAAQKFVDSLSAVPKLSGELKGSKAKDEKREDWDLDAWLEKDPEGLNAMAETDPEKFKKLNNLK